MPKYVMLPPLNDEERSWVPRLRELFPNFEVATPDEASAAEALVNADGA